MNTPYRITEKAIQDLEDIWLYTFETWSETQADKYYRLIIDKIEFIARHFESGKPVDHIKEGYRSVSVQLHFIFYKRADDGITEIIRILHQQMDIENHLRKKF